MSAERLECFRCGGMFVRAHNRGALPKYCPDCRQPSEPRPEYAQYPTDLAARREAVGLTCMWLGRKLGVSKQQVSRWEVGRSLAPVDVIERAREVIAAAEVALLRRLIELHPEVAL